MERCPEIEELQAFFRGTYTHVYPDSPSYYSLNRFERTNGEDHFVFEVWPGEDEVRFTWRASGILRLDLKLQGVRTLDISRSAGDKKLIGNVDNMNLRQLFKLQVDPQVSIEWASVRFFGE